MNCCIFLSVRVMKRNQKKCILTESRFWKIPVCWKNMKYNQRERSLQIFLFFSSLFYIFKIIIKQIIPYLLGMCRISGHFLTSGIRYALPDIRYPARPDIRPDINPDLYVKKILPRVKIPSGIFHILIYSQCRYLQKTGSSLMTCCWPHNSLFQIYQISGQISSIRPLPDIQPDIWYPAFRFAGYPANSISGTSLDRTYVKGKFYFKKIALPFGRHFLNCQC